MKIHIVQKGDTFEKIAEEYDVDMNVLIHVNPQVATPDMILTGMKIKIPQKRKQVKNDQKKSFKPKAKIHNNDKGLPEEMMQIPVIEEDDTWKNKLYENMMTKHKEPRFEKQGKNENQQQTSINNTAAWTKQRNPISKIRNLPFDNIPEINLLQVLP